MRSRPGCLTSMVPPEEKSRSHQPLPEMGLPGWVDENAVCFVRPATATCSGEESLDQRLLSGGRFGNALGKAPASRGVVQFAACSCFERVRARRSIWRVSGSVRPAWSLWWRSQARFIESAEKSRTRSGENWIARLDRVRGRKPCQSPSARTIGRLMIQPVMQQERRTSAMRCLQKEKRASLP
jgi:hypothetical protein